MYVFLFLSLVVIFHPFSFSIHSFISFYVWHRVKLDFFIACYTQALAVASTVIHIKRAENRRFFFVTSNFEVAV